MSDPDTADPWSGLLDPGERILWQGQPDARIDWRTLRPMKLIFGLSFCLIGLWVAGATLAGHTAPFPEAVIPLVLGLAFAAVGMRAGLGDPLIDGWQRSRTWYTLTDRRILIATELRGRRQLSDMAITAETRLVLEDGTPGSVAITGPRKMTLRRIEDARSVYALLRQVQQEAE